MTNLFYGEAITDFFIKQAGEGHLTEVVDPLGVRSGKVLKFELHKEDGFPVTPTENPRCQLDSSYIIEDGQTYWTQVRFMFRSEANGGPPPIATTAFLQLLQLYGNPKEKVTPFGIQLQDLESKGENWLEFRRNESYGFDTPWREKAKLDHWYNLVVRVKFATEGFVEVWLDGEQLTFWQTGKSSHPERADTTKLEYKTRDAGVNDTGKNAWIIQNYRQKGTWEPFSVYFDVDSIATNEADLTLPKMAYVSKSELAFAERTSMEVSRPTELQVGDILLILPYIEKAKALASSGATSINTQLTWNTNKRAAAFWLEHTGGEAKIPVTWEGNELTGCTCLILAYRSVKRSAPINIASSWEEKASSTTPVCPSVTTTAKNTTVVAITSNTGGKAVTETPAGMTLRSQLSPDAADGGQSEAGASGTKTFTLGGASVTSVMTLALTPEESSSATFPQPLGGRNRIKQGG